MGNRFAAPAVQLGILMTIIPALRQSVSGRSWDTFLRQNSGDLRRTVSVNAKAEDLTNHLGRLIIDHPKVLIRFRMLVAVDRIGKMLSRLSLNFENGSDLLRRIPGVPVIKNVLESHQLVLRFECIHAVIDRNVTDIIIRKYDLDVLASFQIVTT